VARRIVLLPGDGIGPEVSAAARSVLDASGADLDWDEHTVGLDRLAAGGAEPLPERTVRAIADCRVALKGPLTTPADGSMPSVSMALRRELDLHTQVRLMRSRPGVPGRAEDVDLVLVRQASEDVYAGIEFAAGSADAAELAGWLAGRGLAVPDGAAMAVKVTSAAAARRTFGHAAEEATRTGRTRVTAVHKATVLPGTDGLFVRAGREVLAGYPGLRFDAMAVDAVAAHLVQRPHELQVLVAPSQYGDVLADLGGALVGGIGMVPGANLGGERLGGVAVFEPAHGSAPRQAGRDRANPTAMILSGAWALRHLGEHRAADRVERAVAGVLADGCHTYDLTPGRLGVGSVGTTRFAAAVRERL
jgi:isocitrate dehydrogenase (NAD+)